MLLEDFSNRRKLSSGSTMLNLACSGNANFAMYSGAYYWCAGTSSSGKTVLALGFLAEASINPDFDKYDLVFDNCEGGALMDIEAFYGPRLAKRIQPASEHGASRSVEELYFNLQNRFDKARAKRGRPFIYIQDSMDSLLTEYSDEKFLEKKEAFEEGKEAAGDYGDGKAKMNSICLRRAQFDLRETDSILVILSQIHDNPAARGAQPKQVVAGGHALKYYATWQLWSRVGEELTKTVNNQDRQIGIKSNLELRKNRISGKNWDCSIPIYWSHGIDDTGACVDFLIKEKRISADKKIISSEDFDFSGRRAELIEKIESENLGDKLRAVVTEVYNDIVRRCAVQLVNKYHKA